MNDTYSFLSRGNVRGARCLPVNQLLEQVNACVSAATPMLRKMTLSSIVDQTVFDFRNVPDSFRNQRAFKVYAIGDEAWGDDDVTEYWFVDSRGTWYWLKCNRAGGDADFSTVTALHLIERRLVANHDDLAHIDVLGTIAERFRREFSKADGLAILRAEEFRKAALKMGGVAHAVSQVVDPR